MCDPCGACREFTAAVLFLLLVGASLGAGGYIVKLFLLVYAKPDGISVSDVPELDNDFWEYNFEYSVYFTVAWAGFFLAGWLIYAAIKHTTLCICQALFGCLFRGLTRMFFACFPFLDCGCTERPRRARDAYMQAQTAFVDDPASVMYVQYKPQGREGTRPAAYLQTKPVWVGARPRAAQKELQQPERNGGYAQDDAFDCV